MRNFKRGLLASAAALAFTSGAALAQNDNDGLLGDTLNDVTGTVSDTVDNVTGTVSDTIDTTVDTVDTTVNDTVGNIGSDNSVSDTVGDITGNQGDASVGDIGDIGNFDNVLGSVGDVDASDLADISQIQIVDVSDLGNFDADLLNDTLNVTDVTGLQDAINGNDVLSGALSGNAVDLSEIIAIDNQQNGTLVIYTNES